MPTYVAIRRRTKDRPQREESLRGKASGNCKICSLEITFFKEKLLCGHHFHGDCIWRWLKKYTPDPKGPRLDCPLCGPIEPPSRSTSRSSSRRSSVSSVSRASTLSRSSSTSSGSSRDISPSPAQSRAPRKYK